MGKYYKHFKDKPYRYLGVAKFSETLEEMVVYETLYHNPEGALWVRPRGMFEELVERNGVSQPRFRKVDFEIERLTSTMALDLAAIMKVASKVLRPVSEDDLFARLNRHERVLVQVCRLEGQVAGFKIGYALTPQRFYSWLGGVAPEFQRLGVASALMADQHEWCKEHGFKEVETRTTNDNPSMLILNVRHGFQVTGTKAGSRGEVKIVLEKHLS